MLRLGHVAGAAIWMLAARLPVEMARFLMVLSILGGVGAGLWLNADPTRVAGFVQEWIPSSGTAQVFAHVSLVPGEDFGQVVGFPVHLISELDRDGPVWVIAQGEMGRHGGLVADTHRIVSFDWLLQILSALKALHGPVLLAIAVALILVAPLSSAGLCAAGAGGAGFLLAWSSLGFLGFDGAIIGTGLTDMMLAGFAATALGALTFRVVTALPLGGIARLSAALGAGVLMASDLLTLSQVPVWVLPLALALMPGWAAACVAAAIAVPALSATQAAEPMVLAGCVGILTVLRTALAPRPHPYGPLRPAKTLGGLWQSPEPTPPGLDRLGRFRWHDALEGQK